MPQRHHGVHFHGSPRGNVTGSEGGDRQKNRHANKRRRIRRLNLEEHAAQNSCQSQSSSNADGNADNGEQHPFSQNHVEDVRPLRTQRHPHANLMRPLDDGIGDHAVDPDDRQRQSEGVERSHERRLESRFCGGIGEDLIQRLDMAD